MKNEATLKFYPKTDKKSKKNEKIPMYMRVIFNGKKAEKRLKNSINEYEEHSWIKHQERFLDKTHLCNNEINEITIAFEALKTTKQLISNFNHPAEIIKEIIKENNVQYITVLGYCNEYFDSKIKNNPNLAAGTKTNYSKSINHLNVFLKSQKNKNLGIRNLTPPIVKEFWSFLLENNEKLGRKGMTPVSATSIISKLKPIFESAWEDSIIERNPFNVLKSRLEHRSPEKQYLLSSQIKELFNLDLTKHQNLQLTRDLMLFSIFTGTSYIDLINYKRESLIKSGDEYYTTFNRIKSKQKCTFFHTTFSMNLLRKYENEPRPAISNYGFPHLCNQKYNQRLKFIGELIGLNFSLNSHTGRHTYCNLLNEAEIINPIIKKTMEGRSFHSVYEKVTEQMLLSAKNQLQTYLNQLLNGELK